MALDGLALRMGSSVTVLRAGQRLGRAFECEIYVDHPSVSRHHCAVEVSDGCVWLKDLGSRFGTFVNGTRVEGRAAIDVSDEVRIGHVLGRVTVVNPVLSCTVDASGSFVPVAVRSVDRLQELLELSRLLARPLALDAMIEQVVAQACRVFDASHTAVVLVGPDGALTAQGAVGDPAYSHTIAQWVLENRQAAVFADAAEDARTADAGSVVALSIRSCMAAPLLAGDRAVGVLYLDHRSEADRFGPDDLAFLGAFANQVAVAVENAWLRRERDAEAEARSTLQRFFPPAALPVLLASGGRFEPIEVEVTAMFCDIVDFTGIASRISPRELIALLNRYFAVVSEAVFARGGTLEKYVGDAVLAVWGAPIPSTDHQERAMEAAIAVLSALAALDPPISVHIGLNSGVVAAGNVGTPTYLQYASFGDATNVASRVSGLAEGGEIVVTEAVWSRLASPFPAEAEIRAVKGKAEPLTIYRWRGPPAVR